MIILNEKCKITNWGGGGGKCKESVRNKGGGGGQKSIKCVRVLFEQPLCEFDKIESNNYTGKSIQLIAAQCMIEKNSCSLICCTVCYSPFCKQATYLPLDYSSLKSKAGDLLHDGYILPSSFLCLIKRIR